MLDGNKFESRNDKLFINGKEVIAGWESFTGCYWFATEKVEERRSGLGTGGSIINGREVDDTIYFGLVQGQVEEWGCFSKAELESLGPYKVWRIPMKNLTWSGRRN